VPWYQALGAHALIHGGVVWLLTGIWWIGLAEAALHASSTTASAPAATASTPTKPYTCSARWRGPRSRSEPHMPEFRKKPVTVTASQWFANGDHPADYAEDDVGFENGELRTFTGAERKANGWEGAVVRYFRRPDVDGERRLPALRPYDARPRLDRHAGGRTHRLSRRLDHHRR
jgi:hypothetical protein